MDLVTGAAGHIGNVLVRELLASGRQVRTLVLPGEDLQSLQGLNVEKVEGDVLDLPSLNHAMQGIEFVYHLAGVISILPGRNEFVRKVNIDGTKNVLQAARQARVKRVLYTSSIHALSRDCSGMIDENVPFDATNPAGEYDRSKAEASLAVLREVRAGLDAVIVCPTGVIGPHDYRDSEMGGLLCDLMKRKTHLLIDGAYDFVDVRDVARGMLKAMQKGRKGEVYILSGEQIKFKRMKEIIQKYTGFVTPSIQIPIWLAKITAGFSPLYYRLTRQTPKLTAYSLETVCGNSLISSAKAKRELGYISRPLAKTFADTIRWWRRKKQVGSA